LAGGDPEIQQNEPGAEAGHGLERLGGVVGGLEVADSPIAEPLPAEADGVGVPVDGQDLVAGPAERLGVTATAQRGVHHPPRARRCRDDRLEQHRHVIGSGRIGHGPGGLK
jgi:hypothetical protein